MGGCVSTHTERTNIILLQTSNKLNENVNYDSESDNSYPCCDDVLNCDCNDPKDGNNTYNPKICCPICSEFYDNKKIKKCKIKRCQHYMCSTCIDTYKDYINNEYREYAKYGVKMYKKCPTCSCELDVFSKKEFKTNYPPLTNHMKSPNNHVKLIDGWGISEADNHIQLPNQVW